MAAGFRKEIEASEFPVLMGDEVAVYGGEEEEIVRSVVCHIMFLLLGFWVLDTRLMMIDDVQ